MKQHQFGQTLVQFNFIICLNVLLIIQPSTKETHTLIYLNPGVHIQVLPGCNGR